MENTEITVSMKTAMVEHQHICECYTEKYQRL